MAKRTWTLETAKAFLKKNGAVINKQGLFSVKPAFVGRTALGAADFLNKNTKQKVAFAH